MSVNDDMFVSASNAFSNFAVIMHPFRNTSTGGAIRCNMKYDVTDRYVHSVAVAGIAKNSTDAEHFIFVFAAEKMLTMTPYVCIGHMTKSTCNSTVQCTDMGTGGFHQEYFLMGVDNNGTFAYGFASSFVFKLDIYANNITLNVSTKSVWPSSGFIPHAIDVADTWAVVACYGYLDDVKKNYAALGCLINLSILINASCTNLTSEKTYLVSSNVILYNELYELSVAIRDQKVLVGVHRLATVVIVQNLGSSLNVTAKHTLSYLDASSFGRVVDWVDDTTIAVLVQDPDATSWSKSQVFLYDEHSVTLSSPIFTFPNNQQILGSRLSRPSFARFGITSGSNMAILTDNADILIIPIAFAGYTSIWIDPTERVFVFYFQPNLCIGGTYKNRSSLGPCQICPSHTRNPGTFVNGVLQCIPCTNNSSTSFCPFASLADVDLSTVPSYSQAVASPETGDTTDVEDLLLKNMFQLNSDSRCLVISPILWTLIVGGVCFSILVFLIAVKTCKCQSCRECRKKAKYIFKHTDIIGEGEKLAGGLATLAVLVLVSFSYWFSVSFIRRYPIEEVVEPARFACDQSLVNAQFSSGLVLLDIPKSQGSQPIFDLLDAQIFYLTVELINTGFICNSVTIQENLSGTKYVHLANNCTRSVSEATTSITLPVPRHETSVQINMTGPYWIGAIRLCIRGQGQTSMSSTLRQLDFCQFYATPNEAIGRLTYIPIVFIKNINMTYALGASDQTLYTGLWMPTFTTVSLSDEAYYVEFGNYLRYMSSLTIIQIMFDERPFFIKNIQQPIVRTGELVFKLLLFTFLCIELFAFMFLFIKLLIIPLLRRIVPSLKKRHGHNVKSDSSNGSPKSSLRLNASNKKDSIRKITASETDPSILNKNYQGKHKKYSTSNIELNLSKINYRF
ncbi:unnamed protein product [Rotaria sordida]|uniref:Transmembrane protein n=1 Tax=Rotaria sordida TaxID=392033 RepID=A0A815LG93_9BILA|nr:unnamed protein product [Rotaria sordida]CAF4000888.1 unnamed protein product [Rotaria sordida]